METAIIKELPIDIQEQVTKIITEIISSIEVERIYLNKGTSHHSFIYQFNIILTLNDKEGFESIRPVLAKVFSNYEDFSYRVFSFAFTQDELQQGNLYFLNNCHENNLVYKTNQDNFIWSYPNPITSQLVEKIKQDFKRDMSRMKSFKKGIHYFRTEKKLSQSAFMMHQSFEQGYRILERFLCGTIKICHSIKNHQTYVSKSLKELESMFSVASDVEMDLLDVLEDAYSNARYSHNYKITEKQLDQLSQKLGMFIKEISYLFTGEITLFKEILLDEAIASNSLPTIEKSSKKTSYEKTLNMKNMKRKAKKVKQVKKLMETFSGVKTEPFRQGTRKTIGFEVLDYEDITSSISALLEVCYYALDGDGSFIAQKHDNKSQMSSVTKVLEIVIDLLPHQQMFCMDKITEIFADEKKKTTTI